MLFGEVLLPSLSAVLSGMMSSSYTSELRFRGISYRLRKEEEKVKQSAVCFCVSLCKFEHGFVGPLHWEGSGSWWHSVLPSVENKQGAQ